MVDPIESFSRVIHIFAAILLLGGAIFTRYVLFPSLNDLSPDSQSRMRDSVAKRWRYVVAAAIALLIVTGFYNFLVVQLPLHRGDSYYHRWMGIKIVLAFVVFFFASALPGRSRKLEWVRRNAKFWLTFSIMLGTFIVVIGGVLKVRGIPQAAPPAAEAD